MFSCNVLVNSFVALAKELLQIDGVKFLLSEKFTQDPLEEHFGRQRRRGGTNDNPNASRIWGSRASIKCDAIRYDARNRW